MLGSVTAGPGRFKPLRATAYQLGQVASPDDCWLGSRGLRTMGVRLAQHQASALQVARWLSERAEVARVLHPALPSCPGHDLFVRDFDGASGLFSFVLANGDEASRAAFIDALDLFGIGFSWGGYESLAVPADPARALGHNDTPGAIVRLHIGLEDPADLIADLDRGFAAFAEARR
jgi:cystathionine beta-lyase